MSEHDGVTLSSALSTITFKGASVTLSPLTFELVAELLRHHPKPITHEGLASALYGHVSDDELVRTRNRIGVFVCHIRKAFRNAGIALEIVARKGWGERGGYALIVKA